MPFQREVAAATLINAAAALHANWNSLAPALQDQIKRLIDEYGHEIFQKNAANRVVSIGRLLDNLAGLSGLPQPVLDALAAGAGMSGMGFVRISDEQRDQVLEALCLVFDARRYDEPYQLAEELRGRVSQAKGQLDPATLVRWEQLDAAYRAGGNPAQYLDAVGALLGDLLPFVRDAISAGKNWGAVARLSAARPPSGGSKGLGDMGGELPFAGPPAGVDRDLGAPTSGAVPPAPPSPQPGTPAPASAAAPVVQRSANVYFPNTVQLGQSMIPLIVHIAQEQAQGTVEVKLGSSGVTVSAGDLKIFVLTADFTVERAIGGAEIPDVEYGRIVRVDPARDSEPVVFFLTPTSAGQKRISIEFKQFGKRIGSLAFDVGVVEEAVPAVQVSNVVDNKGAFPVATRGVTANQAIDVPDLDLRVGRQGNVLTYTLSSGDGKYDERKLGQKALQVDPGPYFASITGELSDLAAKKPEYRTDEDKERPAVLGARLWDEVLSDELRQVYRDDLRLNYAGKSLKITTDEPWVPWEMLKPKEIDGNPFSDPPLCEKFRVTRWLDGPGAPDQVQIKRGVMVAPDEVTLPSVVQELAYFTPLKWIVPVHTIGEVNQELGKGEAQFFHFSCHGGTDPTDAWLKLGDDDLRASNIRYGDNIKLAMTFVFLNACEAGQVNLTLTGLGGWAQAFLKQRASVFIGTLWSINDKLASQFARSFYDCLLGLNGQQPQPIGAAFQAARQAIKAQDPDNPTWLAYVLYGDPNGKVFVTQ